MSKTKKNKTIVETAPETVNETVTAETVVETPVAEKEIVYTGKIKDCDKLNVREEPNVESKVLCKLDKTSEVQVDKTKSTKDFYKVNLSSGISGYCMKKYMFIKKREA